MKIGFIGAGKVGFSLGKFFSHNGITVTGYYSRHRESAQEAAEFTGSMCYDALGALIQDSDALFLTVTDAAIPSVFQQLKEFELSGKQICHCSGAMSAQEAFSGIAQTGAYGYSIHPLFPISSKLESYRELSGAFFCIEGDETHLSDWEALLSSLGPQVRIISGASKVRYHAACAIASNLMCALVQQSLDLLADCGFDTRDALDALAPLMRSNLSHLIDDGPKHALTGPAERCDLVTVEKHLQAMPEGNARALYCAASEKLVQIAASKHPDRDYQPLIQLLKQER